MRLATLLVLCLASTCAPPAVRADDAPATRELFRADLGLTFSRFEQQVKTEIGGARGERLVSETAFGLEAVGTWRFWGPFSAGVFTRFDVGERSAARFESFAPDGTPMTTEPLGGSYTELWLGPVLRAQWRAVFAELGWAPLALRWDDGRPDLRNTSGETEGAFRTTPAVSWRIAVGGMVPLWRQLHLVLRMSYRVRYYVARGGEDLEDDMAHGTQGFTPFAGVAWVFDAPAEATPPPER